MGHLGFRILGCHGCILAAQKRNFAFYSCFLKFAQRTSSESNGTHMIEPGWTFDFTCFSCGKAIPYSKSPATLLLRVTGLTASMSLCEKNGTISFMTLIRNHALSWPPWGMHRLITCQPGWSSADDTFCCTVVCLLLVIVCYYSFHVPT